MKQELNLPAIFSKIKDDLIWDRLRKKYVKLNPEEWVRQHLIGYLIDHLNYPEGLMASEFTVDYNGMKKRCDIVGFNRDLSPSFIVECKAPSIQISEDTFYQTARYVSTLKAKMLVLSNGIDHYCAKIDQAENKLIYLKEIPPFSEV